MKSINWPLLILVFIATFIFSLRWLNKNGNQETKYNIEIITRSGTSSSGTFYQNASKDANRFTVIMDSMGVNNRSDTVTITYYEIK